MKEPLLEQLQSLELKLNVLLCHHALEDLKVVSCPHLKIQTFKRFYIYFFQSLPVNIFRWYGILSTPFYFSKSISPSPKRC